MGERVAVNFYEKGDTCAVLHRRTCYHIPKELVDVGDEVHHSLGYWMLFNTEDEAIASAEAYQTQHPNKDINLQTAKVLPMTGNLAQTIGDFAIHSLCLQ